MGIFGKQPAGAPPDLDELFAQLEKQRETVRSMTVAIDD